MIWVPRRKALRRQDQSGGPEGIYKTKGSTPEMPSLRRIVSGIPHLSTLGSLRDVRLGLVLPIPPRDSGLHRCGVDTFLVDCLRILSTSREVGDATKVGK